MERRIRLAQITDVHVGWGTPEPMLERTLEVLRRARPDVTVLTGDYVNRSLEHVRILERYVARMPGTVVATLGNHDYYAGAGAVVDALTRGGAEVLVNASTRVGPPGARLTIGGVDDGSTHHDDPDRALQGVDPALALVLSHHPNTADHISAVGGRLILSGHTHGGQIRPSIGKAFQRLVGIRYFAGWYTVGQARLYVSAGVGQSLDGLRGGDEARPEVAVFDLHPGAPSS